MVAANVWIFRGALERGRYRAGLVRLGDLPQGHPPALRAALRRSVVVRSDAAALARTIRHFSEPLRPSAVAAWLRSRESLSVVNTSVRNASSALPGMPIAMSSTRRRTSTSNSLAACEDAIGPLPRRSIPPPLNRLALLAMAAPERLSFEYTSRLAAAAIDLVVHMAPLPGGRWGGVVSEVIETAGIDDSARGSHGA